VTVNRVQLALNVADLDAAVDFYRRMFGVEVHKRRTGYANFVVADPPLKLVLFEAPNAPQQLNHLGVELRSTDEVMAAAERFERAGLAAHTSEQELCCHAVQDKVYVHAPDVPLGHWEFYTVVDDDPAEAIADDAAQCCQTDGQDSVCCATVGTISTPSAA
jgi:catechol 2,3-dioxygenase-like lactoylglutathione lyase family enzyme